MDAGALAGSLELGWMLIVGGELGSGSLLIYSIPTLWEGTLPF